ncbi:MAG: MucB/RseB C-terminal domain-containing protein [Rubrivivax sp.]
MSARETMSALADGELDSAQAVDEAIAQWAADPEARRAWSDFHTTGDVLRSADLAAHVADDEAFLAALRGRLQAEPEPARAPAVVPLAAVSTARARRARWRPPVWMGSLAAAAGVGAVGLVLWVTQLQPSSEAETPIAQAGPAAGTVAGLPPVPGEPSAGPVPGVPIGGGLGRGLTGSQTVSVDGAPAATGSGAMRQRGGVLDEYLRSHRGTALAPAPVKLEAEGWTMSPLPPGYELQGAVRRLADPGAPGAAGATPPQQLQAVYSDGTRRVSVFIEPLPAGPPREAVAVQAGATTVLAGPHADGAWVTLTGEVPPQTLQDFARALHRRR